MTKQRETDESRPPLYNSEDYIAALKRFSKLTGLQMYLSNGGGGYDVNNDKSEDKGGGGNKSAKSAKNDTSASSTASAATEMTLRQFGSVGEVLVKLKADLESAFPSFFREFLSSKAATNGENGGGSTNGGGGGGSAGSEDADDGVTLLLDLLKAIQLSQTNISGSLNQLGSRANHVMFKRALGDEYDALLCLRLVCGGAGEDSAASQANNLGAAKLVSHPSGLFTVAVCVMSNYSKSRVLSLQLLNRLCDMQNGHKQVSDAISMLRLRFGEPVRFKFLVGMLNSHNASGFQVAALSFLNKFSETSVDVREKIMIQTELEEAGFDSATVNKVLKPAFNEALEEEVDRWTRNYVDVNGLARKLLEAERANKRLREELAAAKRALSKATSINKSAIEMTMPHPQSPSSPKTKRSKPPRTSRSTHQARNEPREVDLIDAGELTDDAGCENDDENEDDEDVLMFLPSNAFEQGNGCNLNKSGSRVSVDASGGCERMVTVLASDGYTCVTTTAAESNNGQRRQQEQQQLARRLPGSGDSGLSSDSSEKDSGDNANKECNSMERNVLMEEETAVDSDQRISVDAFRRRFCASDASVRKEEIITSSAADDVSAPAKIIVGRSQKVTPTVPPRFRRAAAPVPSSAASTSQPQDDLKSRQKKTKAVEAAVAKGEGGSTSSSSGSFVLQKFSTLSSSSSSHRIGTSPRTYSTPDVDDEEEEEEEDADSFIVPRKAPQPPPMRPNRRPKSTPPHCDSEADDIGRRQKRHKNPRTPNEDDLDEEDEEEYHRRRTQARQAVRQQHLGFLKPWVPNHHHQENSKPRQRDNAVRRHKSFFSPRGSDHVMKSVVDRKLGGRGVRRSESFNQTRSVGDLSSPPITLLKTELESNEMFLSRRQQRSAAEVVSEEEEERGGEQVYEVERTEKKQQQQQSMSKSRSMDFFKAKLLNIKNKAINNNNYNINNHSRGEWPRDSPPQSTRPSASFSSLGTPPGLWEMATARGGRDGRSRNNYDNYDWRQDTPFWKKQGRWARPSAASRSGPSPAPSAGPSSAAAIEEPWFSPHHGVHYPMQPLQPSLQSTISSWQHHQPSMMQSSGGGKKKKNIFNYPSVPVYLPPPQHVNHGPLLTTGSSTRLDLASFNDQHPRLEITELSDEELPIDEEDDRDAFHHHRNNNTKRHNGNNIFEISSGLY